MRTDKKGVSDIIIAVLLVFFIIILMTTVYYIVIPLIKESAEDIDLKSITTNIDIEHNSVFINESLGKMQFNAKRENDNEKLSFAKVIVSGEGKSSSYLIFDVPLPLESKIYVLNITGMENIKEILIYPSGQEQKIGYVNRREITGNEPGNIDEDIPLINPEKETGTGCISRWNCGEWSACYVTYNLDDLIADEVILDGEQKRICTDENKCLSDAYERKECDTKISVKVKRIEIGSKEYLEVYDLSDKLISRLELIKGKHDVLNIEIPLI